MNAGHPPIALWGDTRAPVWLGSTAPLISPVLTTSNWGARAMPMQEGDHVLLYTDGVWETLADDDGRAEARFTSAIDRTSGGAPLLDTILADVRQELGGRPQSDDPTLMTAALLTP